MNITEIIGNNVRYYREKRGMTQEKLAEKADLSVNSIRNLESSNLADPEENKRGPCAATLHSLARSLHIGISQLFEQRGVDGVGWVESEGGWDWIRELPPERVWFLQQFNELLEQMAEPFPCPGRRDGVRYADYKSGNGWGIEVRTEQGIFQFADLNECRDKMHTFAQRLNQYGTPLAYFKDMVGIEEA